MKRILILFSFLLFAFQVDGQIIRANAFSKAQVSTAIDLTTGLVAYWQFDETSGTNANDEIATADLTTGGSATWNAAGIISYALEGVGAASYAYRLHDNQLSLSTAAMSISCWIRLDILPSAAARVNEIYQGGNTQAPWGPIALYIGTDDKVLFAVYKDDGIAYGQVNSPAISATTWYHVVAVYNGTTTIMYLNGADVSLGAARALTGNLYHYLGPTTVANDQNHDKGFDGYIDEMALYNIALSQTQVTALYNAGAGKQYPW